MVLPGCNLFTVRHFWCATNLPGTTCFSWPPPNAPKLVWSGPVWSGPVWSSPVLSGRSSPVQSTRVQSSQVWSGKSSLVLSNLVRSCPVQSSPIQSSRVQSSTPTFHDHMSLATKNTCGPVNPWPVTHVASVIRCACRHTQANLELRRRARKTRATRRIRGTTASVTIASKPNGLDKTSLDKT